MLPLTKMATNINVWHQRSRKGHTVMIIRYCEVRAFEMSEDVVMMRHFAKHSYPDNVCKSSYVIPHPSIEVMYLNTQSL